MPKCQDLSLARGHISYDLRDLGVEVVSGSPSGRPQCVRSRRNEPHEDNWFVRAACHHIRLHLPIAI